MDIACGGHEDTRAGKDSKNPIAEPEASIAAEDSATKDIVSVHFYMRKADLKAIRKAFCDSTWMLLLGKL